MRYAVACLGTSWGGLFALRKILGDLGAFPLPVIAVQHRHRDSGPALASLLQDCTTLRVTEVHDKDPIEPGHVYVAPPDYHLLIEDGHFSLTTDAPVRFSRPSIDVTFSSAADEFGRRTIGVVLTGANADGSEGLRRIADVGGAAIVQDPATSESSTMPAAALRAVPTAITLALDRIADRLSELAREDDGPGAVPDPRARRVGDRRPDTEYGSREAR